MKQMKRTLSLVLALVMLLSLGTTAFAGEVEEPVQVAEEVAQPVQPAVDAPVEEAPAAEAPVEAAPAAETPAEAAPAAETPVEEAPAAETPAEEAPAAETPVEEAPVVEETEPAEVPVVNAIVGQPQDLTVVSGERAVFSVEVTGSAASFQWQASRDNRRWSNMDAWFYGSSSELSFYPTRLDNGFYFRAVVTFENGEQMISESARLSIASILITAQPEDLSVEPNTEAVFTVGAKGSVYYYQWQYSVNGTRWTNLNTRQYGSSNTLRFVAEAEDDGLYIRALVYARDGSRLATEAAKLTVAVNEPAPEPEVTYEARTLEPETNVAGVALAVDAPEGALPSDAVVNIEEVNAAPYEELTKALLGENTEISNALDINFSTEAEGEIEPKGDVVVYLTVPGISEKKDVSIVHISDSGVATKLPLIPAAELPRALGPDEIAFKSGEFSVYLIVDGKAPDTVVTYRHTYKFKDADGNPYLFVNKLGELTDEQIVKSDEVLYPIPDPVPADGKRFVRWEVNGEALQFETSVGKLTDDKVIIVTPKFEDVANVYFYEAPAGKEGENILLARKIVALNGSVLISDIVAPAGAEQVFVGWTDGTTEYVTKNAEGVIIETSIPSVAADLTLRPILKDAHWIRFNLGERGNGAKYVPAKFVIDNTDLSTLPTTTRTGYTFAGWYLDEAFTNQITDGNGSATAAQQAQLRSALETGNNTLYAKWEAVNTTMPVSVIIWGENANDTEYSYITTKNAGNQAVNATVSVNSNGRLTVNGSAVGNTLLTDFDNADYYNFDHATSTKVKATGTTVVEVFLNRKTYTWNFGIRESLNGWNLTQRADGENWNTNSTYYGSITAKWDEDIRAQFKAMCENAYGSFKKTTYIVFVPVTTSFNRNIWCDGNATTSDGDLHIIGALTNMDKQNNQFWITGIEGEASVRYWTQNVDADATPYNISNYTQKTEANAGVDYKISGEDFIAIQGFTYSQNISEGTTIPSSGLDLYYTRNSYPVALYNVATGTAAAPTQLKEVQVQYEKVLGTVSDITSVTPSCPEQLDEAAYSFAGWFLSPTYSEGMQPVDLSTMEMPAGGIQLYAHWLPKYFLVKIDPNMGELYGEESTYTWIQYPGMLQRYDDVTTINYVKANGDGTHKYEIFTYDYWKSQGYTDQDIWDEYQELARTAKYVEDSGGAYKYEKDAYVLIGWYKLDANGNPESEPYDFGSVVREDMTIQAQWRRSGSYTFVYNATDSKTQATGTTKQDNGGYSDKATTTVLPAPTNVTDKYVFLGWDIVDGSGNSLVGDNLYKPGDEITVNADWATANKTILVMARYASVYDSDAPIPVTYLKFNSNYPNGTTNVETDPAGYPLNTAIALATAPAYTVNGYVLVGWSQNKDADAAVNHDPKLGPIVFGPEDTVGIDSLTPTETVTVKVTVDGKEVTQEVQCNVLYAIWKRGEFYVYHSGVAGGNKETIQVPTSGTYDLTSNLTSGTLYGGYYLKNGVTVNTKAYDGDNWTWTTAETAPGNMISPVAGETYYIKEVPASKYLQPYTQFTYNRSNYDISTLWMISDIDDLNYQETGFYVLSANNKAKVCKSLKITPQAGNTTVTLKPETIFKVKGVSSNAYLTYLKMIDDSLNPNLVANGNSVGMYWITNDGVFVTGTALRTLTGVENAKTLKRSDTTVSSTVIGPTASVDP